MPKQINNNCTGNIILEKIKIHKDKLSVISSEGQKIDCIYETRTAHKKKKLRNFLKDLENKKYDRKN